MTEGDLIAFLGRFDFGTAVSPVADGYVPVKCIARGFRESLCVRLLAV